jgi:Tol biopolymer transport system component
MLVDLNVRSGPSVQFDRVSFLLEDDTARVLGRDPESGWWKIECPPDADGDECWVSGGAQFTVVQSAGEVPTAVAPPTPTPIPPEPPANMAILVMIDQGRLTAVNLDLTQNPPVAVLPRQLVENSNVQQAIIAPDGRAIAFTLLDPATGQNELHVVNLDGSNDRVLVRSADLPAVQEATELPGAATGTLSVQILQIAWLSDARTIIFNSGIINSAGFSPGSHSDLWSVSLDGVVTERLAAGGGEPRFVLSSQDRLLMSGVEEILRANADGSGLESVLTFPAVSLVEALYYPDVQWVAAGSHAFTAVSGTVDVAAPSSIEATLWRIPADGSAEEIGSLQTSVISNPVTWSEDGNRLAYIRRGFSSTRDELVIADANGVNGVAYLDGEQFRFLGWSPNNEDFVFSSPEFYAVGRLGASSTRFPIAPGQTAIQAEWLNGSTFVAAVTDSAGTALTSNTTTGQSVPVANLGRLTAAFDVWTP